MQGAPTAFWAKLATYDASSTQRWHPLADHCADVAACCLALLSQSTIRRRLAQLGEIDDMDQVQVERLCTLAALHDVGKFNLGFQAKARPGTRFVAGHVREVLALWDREESERLAEALDFAAMAEWCVAGAEGLGQLLIASICHHGRPLPIGQGRHDPSIWLSRDGLDPFSGIRALAAATRAWFPHAYAPARESPLPSATQFQHAFSGLVMLADWLGSDERFFPFSEPGDPDRFPTSTRRAQDALRLMGLASTRARHVLGASEPTFDRVSPHEPRDAQSKVMALPARSLGSIVVLESETGSGKTEAALAWFLKLFHAGVVDGLYFALPTRTAATQMHRRVLEAMRRAFGRSDECPPVILAVPGYITVDDQTAQRLPPFEVLWPDEDRFRCRGWAAENAKRYLAGAIAVGTVDQVLLSALTVSHAHLRAAALLRHLLVVDEVHASDAYMTRILEEVLRRHLAAGGHTLLMSATLGAWARERLLWPGQSRPCPSRAASQCEPYPAVAHRDRAGSVQVHPVETPGLAKKVALLCRPWITDPAAVAEEALCAARKGAHMLVVRNLVQDCIATQIELEAATGSDDRNLLFACEGKVAPHHARFAREDREKLDRALERSFGRGARVGGCVVVATQTVQQSLDIDADLLLTDLCPMDVLLQRVGRLHRHERQRPFEFADPTVQVLVPAERDLAGRIGRDAKARGASGLGTVYEDLLVIEATWRELERNERLEIPAMNRALVEATTHPEALHAIAKELGGMWEQHQPNRMGVLLAQRRQADLNLARWDVPFGERECCFPDGELRHRVATRLGLSDRMVKFEQPFLSPFGAQISSLTIPGHLAPRAPDDAEPEKVEASSGSVRFDFGTRPFLYDRLGLRSREEEREEDPADG